MTIAVRIARAPAAEPTEPDFPYLANHTNKGEAVLLITGVSEENSERRVGILLDEGESSSAFGWGSSYIKPLPKGSAIMLVQQ